MMHSNVMHKQIMMHGCIRTVIMYNKYNSPFSLSLFLSFLFFHPSNTIKMALGIPPPDSVIKEGIFIQPLTPIGDSLIGSFFVGIIPLIVVLALLGIFRVPAYGAAASGLFTW